MIRALTSSFRDWGFIALGFSAGALIEAVLALLSGQGVPPHLVWGVFVGPLVVWSLLLRRTVPHRIVLVLGGVALLMYVVRALA